MDSIVSNPGVRLDLDDGTLWSLQSSTDFGMPRLDRAIVSSLMVDGAIVPAAAYSMRALRLVCRIKAPSEDDVAAELQKLIRELDRPTNFLRWQPDVSNPIFFRTMRSEVTRVTWDPAEKRVEADVLAEPFAYGPAETLTSITVNNDPAAGSNGMYFDITGLKGDVETPPILRIDNTDPFGAGALASVIGVRRWGIPSAAPMVLQCESMTLGTDTTLPGNDAVMSGSGSNYARVSFATATSMQSRLTYANLPSSPSVDARGIYRVFLRCRQSSGTDVIAVHLTFGAPGGTANVVNDTVTLSSTANRKWVDLGLMSMPIFADPVSDGYSGVPMPVVGLGLAIGVQRVSGSGTFDADCLLFVPADDRHMAVKWPNVGTQPPTYLVIDGPNNEVYPADAGPQIHSNNQGTSVVGGLPMLSPNTTNRVVMILNAGLSNQSDDKADTVTIVLTYYPRYLYVRPVTT